MKTLSPRRLLVSTVATAAALAPTLTFGADQALAVPAPPTHKVEVSRTVKDKVDFRRLVGRCTTTDGGTCTIGTVKSITTTVSVSGGVSVSFVAGQIGFSTSQSSSTTANCTSPKLKSGQAWSAYARGTGKYYTIWNKVSGHWVQQGGIHHAWEPHTFPDIWCGFYL